MHQCRAGLYSFTSTTSWLYETGMASPPLLVVLSLTLPDSRIVDGIAGIGMTLANITILLPYLRQPMLDSIQAHENALTCGQCIQTPIDPPPNESNVTQQVDLKTRGPVLELISPCGTGHQSLSVESTCSPITELAEHLNVNFKVALPTVQPLPVGNAAGGQTPPQIARSSHADSSEKHINDDHSVERESTFHILLPALDASQTVFFNSEVGISSNHDLSQFSPRISYLPDTDASEKHIGDGHPFTEEGQSALHISLPIPNTSAIAYFDAKDDILSGHDSEEECAVATCDQGMVPKEPSTVHVDGRIAKEVVARGGQRVAVDLSSIPGIPRDSTKAITDEPVTVADHHDTVALGTTIRLPGGPVARQGAAQNNQVVPLIREKQATTKLRPESLAFVPQSVIRRYPATPMASAGHCVGHRAFRSGPGSQVANSTAPPYILMHNPSRPLQGVELRDALEGNYCTSFLPKIHLKRQQMGSCALVIQGAPTQESIKQGSGLKPPTVHGSTPLTKRRHRLGVLSRAALRDRRSAARRDLDDSSISDSDTESSGSQYSSGSSAGESMLPHILGAGLIAAIDANSESELNLLGSKKAMPSPPDVRGNILVSEDSTADISMLVHMSTKDDASDGEVRAPATFRSLTYEDIQQWASGVVQKCVRQVCHTRAPIEPLSPSQVSDVCAERPSGSGKSQCPLSGLHSKVGATTLTEAPTPGTKELSTSLLPAAVAPTSRLLLGQSLRDIPKFVPHQRRATIVAHGTQRPVTRPAINVTRDAATEVIARMESQVGYNARQHYVHGQEADRGQHNPHLARRDGVFLALG